MTSPNKRRSGPVKAASQRSGDRVARNPRREVFGRQWRREVNRMTDAELILCVRAQVAVDHAYNTFRKGTDRAVFLPPSETPAGWDA
jgi:hypothetical protein